MPLQFSQLVELLKCGGECIDLPRVLHLVPGIGFDQRRIDFRQHVGPALAECLERPDLRAGTVP